MQANEEVIQTGAISLLGRERPDLLVVLCAENFLPYNQLIHALKALEWYPDKMGMFLQLQQLLDSPCSEVAEQAAKTLGIEDGDPGQFI